MKKHACEMLKHCLNIFGGGNLPELCVSIISQHHIPSQL